jgi:FimV-like protein
MCQLRLGQKDEAIRNLEEVRNNTRDRTIGYLAKKVLATYYMESGNMKEAVNILEGMIRDPQCELPKDILRMDLAKAYLASGKREEAQKLLKEAREESKPSILSSMMIREMERLEKTAPVSASPKPE